MRNWLIDLYTPPDRLAVRRILEQIGWAEHSIASAQQNAEAFSRQPDRFGAFFARDGERAIGFALVRFPELSPLAHLHTLAVDPAFQRQGVASALAAHVETVAQAKQAGGIYIDTPTTNTVARKFYEARGYTMVNILPRYYHDGVDGVKYQKLFA